jgi:hypothetical protein
MFATAVDYDKEELDRAIAEAKARFSDDIERIDYSVRDDWAGDPGLFFRVLMKDRGNTSSDLLHSPELPEILSISQGVMADLIDALRAYRIQPYFSFRLVSEQERLRDPQWD